MKPEILTRPGEIANALKALDLDHEVIREALLGGEAARDACTENDPLSAPGFFAWSFSTRKLRELLIPRSWTRRDLDGLALVVSPSAKMAIVVSTGDTETGKSS